MNRRTAIATAIGLGLGIIAPGDRRALGADMATPTTGNTYDMHLTRQFDAPVARVWHAWTESEQVKRWWGPQGFTAPVAEMDVRVGGTSLVCMRSPEGQDLYNTWTYTVVEPLERLQFISHFADADGNRISPTDVGLPPDIPEEVPHIVTFETLDDDRTKLTVTEFGYSNEAITEMSKAGMNQCLDKMAETFG